MEMVISDQTEGEVFFLLLLQNPETTVCIVLFVADILNIGKFVVGGVTRPAPSFSLFSATF